MTSSWPYHHHLMMLVEHDDELERFLSHTHDNVGLAFDTGTPLSPGSRSRAYCTNMATVSAICI